MKAENRINSMQPPLVSIVVITYNASKYVLETMESAKAQTYQNIELIISDDCSTDNTIEICEQWLSKNKTRFFSTSLINANKNSGIPANINRGLKKANGVWIKVIAGDDALFPDAIENMLSVINHNPQIEILLTQIEVFKDFFDSENFITISPKDWNNSEILSERSNLKDQIEYLLSGFHFPAPGFYLKHDLIKKVGGYDESFKLIEDIPFFLKVLFSGRKIYFKPIPTVKYRKHSENLTAVNDNIFRSYYLQYCQILYNNSKQYGKTKFVIINLWNLYFAKLIFKLGNRGKICSILNKIRIYLHPRRGFSLLKL